MKVLLQEAWSFILYQHGKRHFLSVVCGTSAMYEINLELSEQEIEAFQQGGKTWAAQLTRRVQAQPKSYTDRHLDLNNLESI